MAINAVFYENTVPRGTGVLAIQDDEGATDLFVPLRSTSVAGAFHGPVGSLVVTQTFRFPATAMDRPIEALYRFPLPGDAAVTDVVATFGDETVAPASPGERPPSRSTTTRSRAEKRPCSSRASRRTSSPST